MNSESRNDVQKTRILVLLVIASNVLGNVSLSQGMHQVGRIISASPLDYLRAFANPWTLVGIIALCTTLGDVLNTAGMKRQGEIEDLSLGSLARMIRRIFRNSLVLVGFAALTISFFALLSLLSITTVSFAVPATAVSYLLETLLAKYILGEDVRWRRWAAATLVACGVVLLSF